MAGQTLAKETQIYKRRWWTFLVLGVVAKARAGFGSVISNVSFQIGGALGVAALGSALSSVYRAKMVVALALLASLPAEAINAAKESVGAAVMVAARLPEGGKVHSEAYRYWPERASWRDGR
jgi:hypothetical protein